MLLLIIIDFLVFSFGNTKTYLVCKFRSHIFAFSFPTTFLPESTGQAIEGPEHKMVVDRAFGVKGRYFEAWFRKLISG